MNGPMQYNFRPKLGANIQQISLSDERIIFDFLLERSRQIKAGDRETDQVISEPLPAEDADRED
jgi:hypothetical protein